MNWKGFGRKRPWPNLKVLSRHSPGRPKDTCTPSALRLACRVSLDARRDTRQNQPVVCNTAVLTGRMAPDSTPSAKLCEAPGNEQCWLFAWHDLSCSLPGKNISSAQCISGRKYGIPTTEATKTLISCRKNGLRPLLPSQCENTYSFQTFITPPSSNSQQNDMMVFTDRPI
jgi:hypothetical protein